MNWRTGMIASVAASWFAVTVAAAAEPAQQKAAAKPAATESTDKDKDKEKSKKKEQKCASTTGSRIRRDPVDCEHSAPGERTYTADDIAMTGEMDVSDALRKLDPRFQ